VTVCYVTDTAAPTTCKRRRRRTVEEEAPEGGIAPSLRTAGAAKRVDEEEFQRVEDRGPDGEREGKFLLYWLTTTTTISTTVFTATSSIASIVCTPAGYTNAECPAGR
jgi:hypothetical protein